MDTRVIKIVKNTLDTNRDSCIINGEDTRDWFCDAQGSGELHNVQFFRTLPRFEKRVGLGAGLSTATEKPLAR
jgi:hypothetical protein